MSLTPCSGRPARCSAWWPWIPAAGIAAAPCWPRNSARPRRSGWTGRPATGRLSPERCSTAPRMFPSLPHLGRRPGIGSNGCGCCTTTASRLPMRLSSCSAVWPRPARRRCWARRSRTGPTARSSWRPASRWTRPPGGLPASSRERWIRASTIAIATRSRSAAPGCWSAATSGTRSADSIPPWACSWTTSISAGGCTRPATGARSSPTRGRPRRPVSVGRRVRMLDRRNGLLTLLGNLPFRQMLTSAAGNAFVSLLRISFFLLAKRLAAAVDEAAALVAALGHPVRLMRLRRRRSRGRRAAYARIRADLPPGRSMRRLMEFGASALFKSAQVDTAGAHHASADPTDDDSMLVDNGLTRRLLTSPTALTLIFLAAVAPVPGRSLLGTGPLGGGALIPTWGGASDLWHTYLQTFHPTGIGSTTPAPPYLVVIASLATLLGGKPWLAIDVILLGCVPLAGMSAMLAVRRLTRSAAVRVWAAVSYALLPVAMGVFAGGRFGTAVVFVLLPLIALQSAHILGSPRQQALRAAWATGLLVTIGAMFVPLLWLLALAGTVLAAVFYRNTRRGLLGNLAIVALMAPVLLLPWTLTLIAQPAELLLEAGLQQPGTATAGLPARSLMLLSPGGPGLPPFWVTAGLILAALAALLAGRRRRLIMAGWVVAMAGLLAAIVVSRMTVTPTDGSSPVVVWPGLPLAIAAIGLLLAAAAGADALDRKS